MKKQYIDPQINYVFMDKDVITASGNAVVELDWEDDGVVITR